ncbi:LAFE_0G15082g1_1 [Lachancea fermentati]|uniref:LAFE_0G15082g1_1 n=1 Tax=Lachancea fermentati TaxID=4955 RepID=A0A1G4MIC4_LACFM|nr:LAFE_0G15082g1_1 [Lachancea fermentati]
MINVTYKRLGVLRRTYSQVAAPTKKQLSLPHKEVVELAYDLHLPERSVIKRMPCHPSEPIVFLHGLFGSKRNYKSDCQKIATALQTPVYTLDLRNHGLSEHAMPFDYNTLVNDVLNFLQKRQLNKVNVVGYSLGAKIAMLAALKHPEKFTSACIIDNSPVVQPQIRPFLKVFVKSCVHVIDQGAVSARDKLWRHKASQALKRYIPNGGIRDYLLNNVIINPPKRHEYRSPVIDYEDGFIHFRNPVRHMVQCAVADVSDWPVDIVQGKQFLGPVNFIKGTKSDFIDRKGEDAIAQYFPYYNVHPINATHFILNERPQEYVKAVVDFFKTTRAKLEKKRHTTEAAINDSPSKTLVKERNVN